MADRIDAPLAPAPPDAAARSDGTTAARGAHDRQAERAKLRQLAQEFEALLLNEMLSGWRRSLMNDDDSEPGGLANATEMATSEFGRALSRSGGLGIAAVLERAFEREQDGRGSGVSSAAGAAGGSRATLGAGELSVRDMGPKAEAPSGRSVQYAAIPSTRSPEGVTPAAQTTTTARPDDVSNAVTSPYGWRRDPFSGQAKFHAGVDVRMAYGQPVSSAATGRVSFSGTQGGYGLTVVVDHGEGLQTRYAHLSSTDVHAGDEVRQGQTIARSGRSGRATGPHLHVEVLQDGRPIDPAGRLKGLDGVADWEAYRSPSIRGLD